MTDDNARFAEAFRLQQAGQSRAALELYRDIAARLLTINLACNIALCHADLGEAEEALVALGPALEARPSDRAVLAASLAVGAALLAAGRYAEGWPLMEARAAVRPDATPPIEVGFPEWRGEPLDGRSILVGVEQGFGDQIMLARFAADLAARGARVTLATRRPLQALLAHAPGVEQVVVLGKGETAEIARHDYWTRYFSLPHRLGVTLETLSGAPYLQAPPDRRARWSGHPGGIGLMWRTSQTGFNAAAKTLPDALAQRLLGRGAVSLQPEHTGVADFADTAAIIERLDLVISVDTSVAHLAGALGKPCWTLLPAKGLDWRWLRGRADSPWYASMRLFRQAPADDPTQAGDWTSVLDEVEAAL